MSYLRVVIGPTFAFREAAGAQFVYLVLFSYAFFLEGFTGLAVTIGAIITLFLVMQMTSSCPMGRQSSSRFASGQPIAGLSEKHLVKRPTNHGNRLAATTR